MKLVLDTNVLLVSISAKSKLHWLFTAFLDGRFTLCVTNEILTEYEEIIGSHMGEEAAQSLMGILENAPNVEFIHTYFQFYLLSNDMDDNKFVDCVIASNSNYLVTHDSDFEFLKNVAFPKITVVNSNELRAILESK